MTKQTVWVHRIEFGRILLEEVSVEKETKKQYVVNDSAATGYRSRLPKDCPTVSMTRDEAMVKIRETVNRNIENMKQRINAMRSALGQLEKGTP